METIPGRHVSCSLSIIVPYGDKQPLRIAEQRKNTSFIQRTKFLQKFTSISRVIVYSSF